MDWHYVVDALLAVVTAVGGWFVKGLQSSIERVSDRLDTLPDTYARRDDVREMYGQILDNLKDISNKIDRKADKN